MNISQILNSISILPEQSEQMLRDRIGKAEFPKGHILLKSNKVETNIYFIKRGIVRAYAKTVGKDITFWFGREGETIISMKSYVANQRGYESIELLEDCELYVLNAKDLHELFEKDINIANWGRKFAEQELLKTEERLISQQFRTATQRYKELIKDRPDLLQRVQLGHVASYLGITQVSLSRIRAEIK